MLRTGFVVLALAVLPALAADDALVALGKQRAAASGARWELRNLRHPVMGAIETAIWLKAQSTDAGRDRILTSVYLSCERVADRIALELANSPAADPKGGVGPMDLPKLTCVGLDAKGAPTRSEIAANWQINDFGDTLARGIPPGQLRRCATIEIAENVALPPKWPKESQRIAIEFSPYARELDDIFDACGETAVYTASSAAPVTSGPPARPTETKAGEAPKPASRPKVVQEWKPAHAIASGRTNVRASASLESQVVTHLLPNQKVLVQPSAGDWWQVRPRAGNAFEGYIRRDRFVLE